MAKLNINELGRGTNFQFSQPPLHFPQDTPVSATSSLPSSRPVQSQYQDVEYPSEYATSNRPVQERTYSASSSRPPIVQYRRGSEIDLDEDLPLVRRHRESNAGSERRRRFAAHTEGIDLNIKGFGRSTNYKYSPPKSEPQWTAAPPGRSRGQYQARGKAIVADERSRSQSRYIGPTAGEIEQLDRSYRMRNTDWKKFFECGRVFKTLWTDFAGPSGENNSEDDQFMSKAKFKVAHGEYVYSKVRRFIVISRHDHSCQCLPVTTYDGKGYRKRNIKLAEHGLIYSGNQPPKTVPGIVMEALRMKETIDGDLDISYINYGRAYCVDTNVKVKEVGMLDGPSRRLLRKYYQAIHSLSHDEDPPPPSGSRQIRETEFLGMGRGWPLQDNDLAGMGSGIGYEGQSRPPNFSASKIAQQMIPDEPAEKTATNQSVIREHYDKNIDFSEGGDIDRVQREWLYKLELSGERSGDDWNAERIYGRENESVVKESQVSAYQARDGVVQPDRATPDIALQSTSLSRTSSVSSLSSLASLGSTLSSAPSAQSSTSSSTLDSSYQQRLEDLLLNDADLHALFETAVLQTTFQRFENNFKRCLHLFSEHLRIEAPASLPKHASKLMRRLSSNVAHSIRRRFESLSSIADPKNHSRQPIISECDSDEDVSDDEEDDGEEIDGQPLRMEEALLATNSFRMLRENFRIFLLSDQISRAVFDCWPVTLPWSETLNIEYSGVSSLVEYLESRPQDQRQLEKILTFTGTDESVEALSCEEYLIREWPQIGRYLVNCLDQRDRTDPFSMLILNTGKPMSDLMFKFA
jgi:hypothetical protein